MLGYIIKHAQEKRGISICSRQMPRASLSSFDDGGHMAYQRIPNTGGSYEGQQLRALGPLRRKSSPMHSTPLDDFKGMLHAYFVRLAAIEDNHHAVLLGASLE
jgi:hypothetical protein